MNAREESVFAEAQGKQDLQELAAYLDRACAGDPALRKNVESLLAAYEAGQFLESPAAGLAATGDETVAPAESSGCRIGPYKLLEPIGEGGMGIVWMAEQQEPVRRLVALKVGSSQGGGLSCDNCWRSCSGGILSSSHQVALGKTKPRRW
jgi:hypothetical protein